MSKKRELAWKRTRKKNKQKKTAWKIFQAVFFELDDSITKKEKAFPAPFF